MFNFVEILDEPLPALTILDIGAANPGNGKEIYSQLLKSETSRVIGFEPDKTECAALNQRFGPRNIYLPYVLFDGSRRKFFVTNTGLTSSLYEPDHDLRKKFNQLSEVAQVVAIKEVDTYRLDDISELKAGVDFIKSDAQGAECEIYNHGINVVSSACLVHTEAHLLPVYKNQPLFSDQDMILRKYGFQFHKFYSFLGRPIKPVVNINNPTQPISQLTQVDVVYAKQFHQIEKMPPEKILKMALILHDLYQSFDFCHWVLAEFDKITKHDLAKRYLARLMHT